MLEPGREQLFAGADASAIMMSRWLRVRRGWEVFAHRSRKVAGALNIQQMRVPSLSHRRANIRNQSVVSSFNLLCLRVLSLRPGGYKSFALGEQRRCSLKRGSL